MADDRCWNCGSAGERVRSKNTSIVYCVSCGAALNGPGAEKSIAARRAEQLPPAEQKDDASLARKTYPNR